MAVAIVAFGAFGACTLTTDLDGYATGRADAGAPPKPPDGGGGDGGHVTTSSDGGDAGPGCNADSDPHNCGVCGKDCLGGECRAGKCQQSVLVSGLDHPLGIAISQDKLYVGAGSGLMEMSLEGKDVTPVVEGVRPLYLWGTDTDVFFSNANDNTVRRWSHTPDGDAPAVTGALPGVNGVAVGSGFLYFARYLNAEQGGGIYRAAYPGAGDPQQVKPWNHAEGLTFADGKVYFAGDGQDSANLLHDDGSVDPLLTRGGPTGIFVVGDDAFITRQGAGQVIRVSIATKETETLANDLGAPSGIVVTATRIYWAEYDSGKVGVLVR